MEPTLCPQTQASAAVSPVRLGWLDRRARETIFRLFRQIDGGEIRVIEGSDAHDFGKSAGPAAVCATVHVHDPRVYVRLAKGGSIAAGETYMDGLWSTDDLPAFLRLMLRNRAAIAPLDGWRAWFANLGHRLWHLVHPNNEKGSQANIAAHYDLGNDFYALWLDESMMYSCALFEREDMPLPEAALAKLELVCRKLALDPRDHVLEIGGGWGGFAIYAAKHFGCKVTTTTISKQQHELALSRVRELGLDDRVRVLCEDYRNLRGQYDKLVSIEMIEAVGERYLDTYFACCSRLLKPHGMMLLQAITLAERFYAAYRRSVDFIQRYIFPGGFLPSIAALCDRLGHVTDLRLCHLEELGAHYARTLAAWRERLLEQAGRLGSLGYSQRFVRMWEYYLAYCEAGFAEQNTGLVQMLLAKPA